jgi:hypothetical protein
MKEVAGKRRRFGYRRIGIMLDVRMTMNHKLYRLWEEGLSVRRRRGANGRGAAAHRCLCRWRRARWSMDFVSDTFGASRKFRILAINDDVAGRTCAWWPIPASPAPGWRANSTRWCASMANRLALSATTS